MLVDLGAVVPGAPSRQLNLPGSTSEDEEASCLCCECQPFFESFRVCQECGNKRCPRNFFHENDCTGSNEPGRVGSADGIRHM